MINRKALLASWVAAIVSLIPTDVVAQGCVMCRAAVSSPDDPTARGFYWSMLFMGTMPFIILGSIGVWLIHSYRRGPGRRRMTAAVLRLVAGKGRYLKTPKENEN